MPNKPIPKLITIDQAINHLGFREWLILELTKAFEEARKGKLKTFNEHLYEVRWPENIVKLADAILSQYYEPSGSVSFIIYDPMIREIFAAPFVDRIVHHFLYNMQNDWWDCHLSYDAYSCRNFKGTSFGIKRIRRMMRSASLNYTKTAYILKFDIRGYFMSLPRQKLYERVKWGLDQQFDLYLDYPALRKLHRTCSYLWHQVLLDDPANKSHRRGLPSQWEDLPPEKSLYTREPGYGIVIGNLTSQLVSNIYLDQFDRFVRFDLGYKYYGRYVDDFFIIVPEDQLKQALGDVSRMEEFLSFELNLTLHPKKRHVQPIDRGVNFLGARIYPHCVYPSNRLQSKLKQSIRTVLSSDHPKYDSLISYLGMFKNLNADKFVKHIFDQYGLNFNLYLEFKSDHHRKTNIIIDELITTCRKPNQTP